MTQQASCPARYAHLLSYIGHLAVHGDVMYSHFVGTLCHRAGSDTLGIKMRPRRSKLPLSLSVGPFVGEAGYAQYP